MEDSALLSPGEQQKWETLDQKFGDELSINGLPAGRPRSGHPMHLIQFVSGAAPSFAPT